MSPSPAALSLTDPASPLLRRTALLPNESLASLLERLTLLNFYTSRGLIPRLGRKRLATVQIVDNLAAPTRLETFQELARLTGLTLDALYAASHQRFADWLVPLDQPAPQTPWLNGTTRSRLDAHHAGDHLRLRTSVQFCPQCLATAAYQRLSWLPRMAAICLEHRCLLLDRCPCCGAALTVTDLVTRRCRLCQIELHHLDSVSLADDQLGLRSQQIIQGWFGVIDPPADALVACQLPPQSPRALYRLLQLIARQLLKGQTEWVNLPHPLADLTKLRVATMGLHGRLTSDQAYVLYRSAFAGLLDWPIGLEQLLDAYGGCDETQTRPPSRRHCLHRIQCDWFRLDWQASSLAFVQPVLLDYVLKRGLRLAPSALEQLKDVPWFAERTGLWTEEQTCRVLDLSLDDLRRFCRNGSLLGCLVPRVPTLAPRFKPGAVLEVKQRWMAGWSVQDVSSWLGLTLTDVLDLVKAGLLPVNKDWPGEGEQSLLKRQAVEELFAQVGARLKPVPESGCELIPWRTAVGEVRRWGVDTAVLIQCVLMGLVSAYCASTRFLMRMDGLKDIYFSQVAIRELPDQLYAIGGLVPGDQFAYDYGFAPGLISKWRHKGLIKPTASVKNHQYFDHQQLKELAAQQGFGSPIRQPVSYRGM